MLVEVELDLAKFEWQEVESGSFAPAVQELGTNGLIGPSLVETKVEKVSL